MARLTMHAIVILPMALACLSAYADDPGAAEKPVADWTLNPAERSARLHRIKRELFTEVSQSIGFSSRLVYGFDQDEQGFIWIGTGNGLDRFDGYTVRSYKHDPGSTDGLSSNSIRTLTVGSNGIVWAGTHATGLDRFDSSTGTAINFRNRPGDPRDIGDDHITEIIVSDTGDIWVGTQTAGLARIDHQSLEVTRFHRSTDSAHQIPGDNILVIFEDLDGGIWVGTDRGLIVASDPYTEFEVVNLDVPGISDPTVIQAMVQSSDRTLYFVADGTQLLRGNIEGDKITSVQEVESKTPVNVNDSNVLMMDSYDRLWYRSGTTVIYDTVTEKFSETNVNATAPFEDRNGTIWFSTEPDVIRLDPDSLVFGVFDTELTEGGRTKIGLPFAILEAPDGSVWVADSRGVRQRHRNSSAFTEFNVTNISTEGINDTNALYQDRGGIIWAGTFGDGVHRIDPVSGRIRRYALYDFGPATNVGQRVWAIEGDDDHLWVGSAENFHVFDIKSDSFAPVPVPDQSAKDMIASGVRALEVGSNNTLWIGTQRGLLQWRMNTNEWHRILHDPENRDGLSNNYINALLLDDDGILWIGTQLGTNRLDPTTGEIRQFSTATGLPNDDIQSLVEDNYGAIWMSTGAGLVALDKKTYELRVLNKKNELQNDEFLLGSGYAGKSGNLYFGGIGTLVYFDPGMLSSNNVSPQVVFTEMRINNEVVLPDFSKPAAVLQAPINLTQTITLPYQSASVALEFAGIHFARPDQNTYAYQLEGYDDDWIYTDSFRRIANYTNLPFGNYVLHVKAANKDGVWNEVGQSLAITILTPYWRTWWAYLLYIVAAVTVLLLIIQLRTRTLTAQALVLEDMVQERTHKIQEHEHLIQAQADDLTKLLGLKEKLFTNISHEFRTPLTLILGPVNRLLQSDVTDKQASHLKLVRQNGQRLLRLVDQLLNLSRLDADEPIALTLQPISQAANVIADSFQPLARFREVTFETTIDDDLWVSASADALERILMNLLSNAFKYTPKGGDISISLTSKGEQVLLVISDSGVGIPLSRHKTIFERFNRADDTGENVPGAGIGLALVREIVGALDGSIDLKSAPSEGATICVTLRRHSCTEPQNPQDIVLSESSNAELELLTQSGYVRDQPTNNQQEENPSILIIEDNQDMQQYLVELLSPSYSCMVAGDGEAGLHMGLDEIPDLVLCDVMLPKMDGYKVSQKLKSDDRSSHIPIIMLTARGDNDSRLLGLREKVDAYLAKPFDDEELLLRIETILGAREILRKHFLKQMFDNGDSESNLGERDRKILEKLNQIVEDHLADSTYDVGAMSSDMAMSERAFQRKLKALSDQTPTQYIRKYRLRKSIGYLRDGMSVNQVAELVGFSSPAYFTSRFREEFGDSPTKFVTKSFRKSQFGAG